MGRVGDDDGQAQLGGGGGEILVEAGKRADAAVDGFGGGALAGEPIAVALGLVDGDAQQLVRLGRPVEAEKAADEIHDILVIGAAGVGARTAVEPALVQLGNGEAERSTWCCTSGVALPSRMGGRSRMVSGVAGRLTIGLSVIELLPASACLIG